MRNFIKALQQSSFILVFVILSGILISCNLRNIKESRGFDEITFVKVCWKDGVAWYPNGFDPKQIHTKCKTTVEDIRWSVVPLRVKIFYKDPAFVKAMNLWNQFLGFNVFVENRIGFDVLFGSSNDTIPAVASTRHLKDKGHLMSVVAVYSQILVYTEEQRVRVYFHELGHVLGLGHDVNDVRSVMHPNSGGSILTSKDLRALQKRYGKK